MIKGWLSNIIKTAKQEKDGLDYLEEIIEKMTIFERNFEENAIPWKNGSSWETIAFKIKTENIEFLDTLPFEPKKVNSYHFQTFIYIDRKDYKKHINTLIYRHYKNSLKDTIEEIKNNKGMYQLVLIKYLETFIEIKNDLESKKDYNYVLRETITEKIYLILKKFESEIRFVKDKHEQKSLQFEGECNKKFNDSFEERLDKQIEYITKY